MKRKSEILRLIHYGQQIINEQVKILPGDALSASGSELKWAYKDHMVHLAHWMERFNQRLAHQPVPALGDLDVENARIWRENQNTDWPVIQNRLAQDYAEIERLVKPLTEEELASEEYLTASDHRALWIAILDAALSHTITHVSQVYKEHGELERSVNIMGAVFDDLLGIDPMERWQGVVIYNFACLNAQAGYQTRTMELLNSALKHYPDLSSWAAKDPDMKPLWDNPQFKSITKNE
jgi:hypothetical protein